MQHACGTYQVTASQQMWVEGKRTIYIYIYIYVCAELFEPAAHKQSQLGVFDFTLSDLSRIVSSRAQVPHDFTTWAELGV